MDDSAQYARVKVLIQTRPEIRSDGRPLTDEQTLWLSRVYAIIDVVLGSAAGSAVKRSISSINVASRARDDDVRMVNAILFRALAVAELKAAPAEQGAFIAANSAFDAFAALSNILQRASSNLLIIDPYMDEKVLTDFGVLIPEIVVIRLLSDESTVKASLTPAVNKWKTQYVGVRPLEAKLASPRSLHDRLVIADGKDVWVMTQSFNAFAARSPASIVKVDAETAALKVKAYNQIWLSGKPV